mmetsp:Transcript_12803/g.19626  ORF Transcript_12803/g.19626 Transcript_12803/m.19626 type:complete len:433 (-) Transcript_12803:17-1315(-)
MKLSAVNLKAFRPIKKTPPIVSWRLGTTISVVATMFLLLNFLEQPFNPHLTHRKTFIYLGDGDGDCEWTDVDGLPEGSTGDDIHGTLFASYPASGMRVTWQQTEGITGVKVYDDFFNLASPKIGMVKTQYPHYEGFWSYGTNLNQVILLIRNPRWALPSYLTLISELNFAHTWELSYEQLSNVFTKRANMSDWIKWRDYRFNDEIRLWGLQIDFYMENGALYWEPYDFERNCQYPFSFLNDSDKPWPQDYHCGNDIDSCYPKAIISFEKLKSPITGPEELLKIANVIRGKNITVMDEDGINCMWHETWVKTPAPSNDDRDANGLPREAYNFTLAQMYTIEEKLVEYETKYSTGIWTNNMEAQDLVANFTLYLGDVRDEIRQMKDDPPPTAAPNVDYEQQLVEWYDSKGKGNRYSHEKVQAMGIWDLVKHFYD